jgi:hypothetical protein
MRVRFHVSVYLQIMSILKVARMGHPCCARKRASREKRTPHAPMRLIDDSGNTMREYHGVGLAAPQMHRGCGCSSRCSIPAMTMTSAGRLNRSPSSTPNHRCRSAVVEDWEAA